MIRGNDCWSADTVSGMRTVSIAGRELSVFCGAPVSPYFMLVKTAERLGEKTAIVDNWNRNYSFSELLLKVDQFSSYLHSTGIARETHVGLLLYNCVEFAIAFLALNKLGAVTVPLPGKYQKPEIRSLVEKGDVAALICDEQYRDWFNSCIGMRIILCENRAQGYGFSNLPIPSVSETYEYRNDIENDTALILFTSGTTSQSKGVLLKNYNIIHSIEAYRRIFHITDRDRTLLATPMYHVTGIIALLGLFIYTGGTLWLMSKVEPRQMLQCILDNQLTFIHASPTVFHLLLEHRDEFHTLPSLQKFACGSSNMPVSSIKKIKSWLPQVEFHTIYGMTEVSSPATIFPTGAASSPYSDSSGVPIPGLNIKIIDDDGREVENGELGEITMYGANVLEAYYNIKCSSLSEDGWLRSGDIGYLNDQGYLWVMDRKKDMINRGGEKICTIDVENAICSIPGVSEAIVAGIPDEKYSEIPVAAVKFEKGCSLTEEEIRTHLSTQIAKYMIPARYVFLPEIPRTANGKPDKKSVKKLFMSHMQP
ncbi:acyl--CoA ligase [Lachnoclostridium pacaense]|uniref:class I adenylate-forming enzyme family protein n=1 Tax=Enterocloster hominis (ex Hitch et al. 2024) TaxID=1917870 RepID=UPI001D107D2E|nr:class I adenylate-forming enzyme family protein [Lachnoclostridium pacaense]MCC2820325.1 acyl--CoA ligase [Lachnoclostridium pacaense]